ncbi:protein-disulfide reductase DsbD [Xanthobacter agilis]|uniref:Thiol:disulfide interchange protein DsbD n=1 Tax=Xanthobacter agilis TaxID=47492 RepID=A0ABU0LBH5_XANAG|nr:protein-disulfide reductase DsbD [Xanthobacter agilis]MDQ0504461.1 thiol:disulfide interchange protein DsbD [Xanthobacter agilis]
MLLRIAVPVLAAVSTLAGPAAASKPLKADEAFRLEATRAADGTLALRWQIAPGTYLYRDSLKAARAGTPVALATSPGEAKDDPNFGAVEVYHHAAEATVGGLPAQGEIKVSYQGCAEAGICYPVVERVVDLASLKIETAGSEFAGAGATLARLSPAPLSSPPSAGVPAGAQGSPPMAIAPKTITQMPAAAGLPEDAAPDRASALFGGNLAVLLVAFLGFGLLLAFTPCVFPMLPILSGILAGAGERPGPARGFALSAAYGLAIAVAYGVLGIAAGWSGANLQAALQTQWALGAMAVVFLLLALSMFGLFELALPSGLARRLPQGRGGSLSGAAALGFASALVVGPCVTPPLAAAMLYAAQTGDAARGGAALFMLGLGMGAPLILVGTFGARILPRSGPWLVRIKQVCGVLFVGVAAVLATRLMPAPAGLALWGALAVGVGVFLGGLDRSRPGHPPVLRLAKAAGLVALIYGGTLLIGAAGGAGDPLRPLSFLAAGAHTAPAPAQEVRVSTPAALDAALAQADGRPMLVSFTAGWCTVCKSNERVMDDPAIRSQLAGLPRIAADVTAYGEGERALMSRFAVVGPPTLFLVDGAGQELPGSRITGAVTAQDIENLVAKARL